LNIREIFKGPCYPFGFIAFIFILLGFQRQQWRSLLLSLAWGKFYQICSLCKTKIYKIFIDNKRTKIGLIFCSSCFFYFKVIKFVGEELKKTLKSNITWTRINYKVGAAAGTKIGSAACLTPEQVE
jgi:hypothetical protein